MNSSMYSHRRALLLVLLPAFLFVPFLLQAQIPRTLSYQGILSDTLGTPKPDGQYAITFRLYDAASGGTALWSETQSLQVKRGLFSAILGSQTAFPSTLTFDRQYWLSIQPASEPELAPRIALTSVGYSLIALRADTARVALNTDSARITGTVPNNSITAAKIAPGQVVKSINNIRDAVTLRAQGGATITSSGDTITINAGSGGGGTGVQGLQNTNNTLDIINPSGPTVTANLKVPLTMSAASNYGNGPVLRVRNTQTNGDNAIEGITQGYIGVYGESQGTYGVYGLSRNTAGVGVYGGTSGVDNQQSAGVYGAGGYHGVVGHTNSTAFAAAGVRGEAIASSGQTIGVEGVSTASPSGTGVAGRGRATGGYFEASAGTGVVSYGNTGVYGESPAGIGVAGSSSNGIGVKGTSTNGDAIEGHSTGINKSGVWGHNDRSDGVGVAGSSVGGVGVSGTSTNGDGVVGATNAANKSGVWGHNDAFNGVGVAGSSTNGYGVSGSAGSVDAKALYGYNSATQSLAAIGLQTVTGGTTHPTGVFAFSSNNARGIAVYGRASSGGQFSNQYAGLFEGNLKVDYDLSVAGSKNFKIDHPLDPTNKYLVHSCVESNDRMNIYNGNVTTDANGNATIILPQWFEALNKDFRYQLTVIGQFAQAIVSSEISDNRFSIKTDKPYVKVSWQVTGIRNDAYARAYPMQVEVEKPAGEKGTYTHPELYGLPARTYDDLKPPKLDHQMQKK
ncbi:MAG TPA: hypothetical protein VNL69_01050 [Bacteroidota bacterium]|nr:hypothetical protein [Bacteroidota bacterium]